MVVCTKGVCNCRADTFWYWFFFVIELFTVIMKSTIYSSFKICWININFIDLQKSRFLILNWTHHILKWTHKWILSSEWYLGNKNWVIFIQTTQNFYWRIQYDPLFDHICLLHVLLSNERILSNEWKAYNRYGKNKRSSCESKTYHGTFSTMAETWTTSRSRKIKIAFYQQRLLYYT